jgi:hypothetical protein
MNVIDLQGELALRANYANGSSIPSSIEVMQADPVVFFTQEAIEAIKAGGPSARHASINGDLITIRATNGTWIYRIGAYQPDAHGYVCSWPD